MKIRQFQVVPNIPDALTALKELAMNHWTGWNEHALAVLRRLDPETWERSYQNPLWFLGKLPHDALVNAADDKAYMSDLRRIYDEFQRYLKDDRWFAKTHPDLKAMRVAYFSLEYAVAESLPIYSGGLGVLAGDHLKSASDLGLPLTGVGLLYREGYFQQRISHDGWQVEHYPHHDWFGMPIYQEKTADGAPLIIEIRIKSEPVKIQVWRVQAGRVPLYLLDTNLQENPPHLRDITDQLYGGDREKRIRQEIVLGVGGVRALQALNIEPTVYHMNEGHSGFLAFERFRRLVVEQKLSFAQAREVIWASTVFTTHTPVPAGNEQFDPNLVISYLGDAAAELGLSTQALTAMGQEIPGKSDTFNMTVLSLRLSAFCNGVSRIHAGVSRQMWRQVWPGLPEDEIPIAWVNNGIHLQTWQNPEIQDLLRRHLGTGFLSNPADEQAWRQVRSIPDEELWSAHQTCKQDLITYSRHHLRGQFQRHGADAARVRSADEALDSEALTIGFARRFATYKRALLIFRDPARLKRLLTNAAKPVQIIFAGKAHPKDTDGKELIRTISHYQNDPDLRGRIVFLENYTIHMARHLVSGVDVWLNNPRRPLEASGTSGMKAAVNGVLNCSSLDGWWPDGWTQETGWAIGEGEAFASEEEQDYVESEALYNLLEQYIIPKYYDRDAENLPLDWIAMMKASIAKLGAAFNTHRMVSEYATRAYAPAHRSYDALTRDGCGAAKRLAEWRQTVELAWAGISVRVLEIDGEGTVKAGDRIEITAEAKLGGLSADDVTVQVIYGPLDSQDEMTRKQMGEMSPARSENGAQIFKAKLPCRYSGRQGYAVRVIPKNKLLIHPFTPILLTWES